MDISLIQQNKTLIRNVAVKSSSCSTIKSINQTTVLNVSVISSLFPESLCSASTSGFHMTIPSEILATPSFGPVCPCIFRSVFIDASSPTIIQSSSPDSRLLQEINSTIWSSFTFNFTGWYHIFRSHMYCRWKFIWGRGIRNNCSRTWSISYRWSWLPGTNIPDIMSYGWRANTTTISTMAHAKFSFGCDNLLDFWYPIYYYTSAAQHGRQSLVDGNRQHTTNDNALCDNLWACEQQCHNILWHGGPPRHNKLDHIRFWVGDQ